MDITERIRQANAEAQERFRTMLAAGTLADPDAVETRAYTSAERTLDHLILDAQFDAVMGTFGHCIADEVPDVDLGNHFVFPA